MGEQEAYYRRVDKLFENKRRREMYRVKSRKKKSERNSSMSGWVTKSKASGPKIFYSYMSTKLKVDTL